MQPEAGPLLVFGPRSSTYDFGPSHPLTPRRFGPGIDLLEAVGARPGLAPEPASDDELRAVHSAEYIRTVRRLSEDPFGTPAAGIARAGDNPAFAGMHEAAAAVAGGSLRAMDAIVRGEATHAFHPGGGLHHAMPGRASGFCIYDDPALAIARARSAGLRVLYVDLDVHHGDGVQEVFRDDPGVLTLSFHESGRYLFPGTGFIDELGEGSAAGSIVNVPLEPLTGESAWLAAIESMVPPLAAAFGPDVIVSQHGADSHAWDPLAHLLVTTSAMGSAARLVDRLAHRWTGGRWLATGGGGYDVYRVVPRAWSLVWLAGAHRDVPNSIPDPWRVRWVVEAERHGQAPLPVTFEDAPNAGLPMDEAQAEAERRSADTVALVRSIVVPALLREGVDRGWCDALVRPSVPADIAPAPSGPNGSPTIVARLGAETIERLALAARVVPIADWTIARELLSSAVRGGATVSAALDGDTIVGIAVSAQARDDPARDDLLCLGLAPSVRGEGLGRRLLAGHLAARQAGARPMRARTTVAERDWVEPSPGTERRAIAMSLLREAGFRVADAPGAVGRSDRTAVFGTLD